MGKHAKSRSREHGLNEDGLLLYVLVSKSRGPDKSSIVLHGELAVADCY